MIFRVSRKKVIGNQYIMNSSALKRNEAMLMELAYLLKKLIYLFLDKYILNLSKLITFIH